MTFASSTPSSSSINDAGSLFGISFFASSSILLLFNTAYHTLNMASEIDIHSKEQPFYISLSQNAPSSAFRELLEKYSKIPSSEIDKHLEEVVRVSPARPVLYYPNIPSAMTPGTTTHTPR
jgi:hypothetical protein